MSLPDIWFIAGTGFVMGMFSPICSMEYLKITRVIALTLWIVLDIALLMVTVIHDVDTQPRTLLTDVSLMWFLVVTTYPFKTASLYSYLSYLKITHQMVRTTSGMIVLYSMVPILTGGVLNIIFHKTFIPTLGYFVPAVILGMGYALIGMLYQYRDRYPPIIVGRCIDGFYHSTFGMLIYLHITR